MTTKKQITLTKEAKRTIQTAIGTAHYQKTLADAEFFKGDYSYANGYVCLHFENSHDVYFIEEEVTQ